MTYYARKLKAGVVVIFCLGLFACLPGFTNDQACRVTKAIFYSDGQFIFTETEIAGLRLVNKRKIATFKKWYKENC